jgi:hypothetical protein
MRKTLKTKNYRKRTRKQKGGNPFPNTKSLKIEFLFNDVFYEIYEKYFLEESTPEEIKERTKETKEYKKILESYINDIKETDGIPYSINKIPPNSITKYLNSNINPDDNVCKGKIDIGQISSSFYNQQPSICILLKNNTNIIGISVFSFTHRHIQHKFGDKINSKNTYIRLDWLCGSKYSKVGTILINTIENIQAYMKTKSIYLISYDSAILFYQKMGYEYLGLSRVGTPMMEKRLI